jgi:hypothetical protein
MYKFIHSSNVVHHKVVRQHDLLSRLEGWQAAIGAATAAERVAECTL